MSCQSQAYSLECCFTVLQFIHHSFQFFFLLILSNPRNSSMSFCKRRSSKTCFTRKNSPQYRGLSIEISHYYEKKRIFFLSENVYLPQIDVVRVQSKQGRIHSNPVADGWAGAVLRKPLGVKQGRIHGCPSRVRVGRGYN